MLLIIYKESCFNNLQRWLSKLRITINVTKCTAINFARAGRSFIQPRPVTLFGEPIKWVDTTRYLEVTTDVRLNWSPHIDHVRKRAAHTMGMLDLFLNTKGDLSVRNGVLPYKQLVRPPIRAPRGVPLPAPMSGGYRCYYPSVFTALMMTPGT